jgi:acylphosphatase
VRCIVSGRVQGVFFRDSTRREAEQLGITGYARNLYDGTVEVLACGEAPAVEQLKAWLWLGPSSAKVTGVECRVVDEPAPGRFTTG